MIIVALCLTQHLCAQDTITIIDDYGVSRDFPKSFVDQHTVLKHIQEDLPGAQAYQLPERIPMKTFEQMYIDSLNNFAKTSIHDLVDYIVYADKLDNAKLQSTLEKALLSKLHNQPLHPTKQWDQERKYVEEILPHFLSLPQEQFTEHLVLDRTNIRNKILNPKDFHQQLLDQTKKKNNWMQILLQKDPSNEIIFSLPATPTAEGQPIEYSIIKDPDTRLMWDKKNTHTSKTFSYLDKKYWNVNQGFFKFSKIDWDSIYIMAYSNNHEQLAFALPGKIVITPKPLSDKPKSSIITLKSKESCTHLAFSCDGKKLSCVVDDKIYIIDLATNKVASITFPTAIFSSIMATDTHLLIRTNYGNTYAYNLKTHQLIHIPDATIDYFTACYAKDRTILVQGLKEVVDSQGNKLIEASEETIDTSTLG